MQLKMRYTRLGERMELVPADNYQDRLEVLRDDLIEALRQAENAGWHHAKPGSEVAQIYTRLSTWISYCSTRLSRLSGC